MCSKLAGDGPYYGEHFSFEYGFKDFCTGKVLDDTVTLNSADKAGVYESKDC